MAEVMTSMTVAVSTDWMNWMKGYDDSEDWRKLLYDFCTKRHVHVSHEGNVIHLSGSFEAIKDVRRALQEKAKQALEKAKQVSEKKSERIMNYKRSDSNDVTNGLEENFEQVKIADPEGTEKREDTKQKRKRILIVKPEQSEGEKSSDVFGSDTIGSDKKDHPDSSTNLIQIQVNQNQSKESQVWDDKSVSLDEKMTKNAEKPTNDLLHVDQKKPESACLDSGQGEPQGHQQQDLITFTDFELSNEITPEFKREKPQIDKSPFQGQMQQPIYPILSQEHSAANSGQISQPIYTPSDHGQRPDHQGQVEQQSYPSQGQGQLTGHQGQLRQQSYPSQDQGQVTSHKEEIEQQSYTLHGQGQVIGHQGQTEQQSYPSQGQGQLTGHEGPVEHDSYPSQCQGQVTHHQSPMGHHSYPSKGQEQVTGHEGQTEQQSYPSQGQGQVTGHQGQTQQQSYPSQGQGQLTGHHSYPSQGQRQLTGHQGQTEQLSYPSQCQEQLTEHQGYPSYPSNGQGQITCHQGQMEQQSYPSQGQGQVIGHQAQIQHLSYSSHGHVTGHQGIRQPFTNPVIPGQNLPPFMCKQFLIKHVTPDSLYFTSNRPYNVLNIFVHKKNIVDQRTQVLVSSANCQLTTHGSVSEAIVRAAGHSVVDECRQIIIAYRFLSIGAVIPTKAGNLGPHVDTILHAVIPTPQEFQADPLRAFNLLSQVFLHCLCVSAGQTKSVSFPAIGSEIFGLQRMVEAFTFGLQTFDQQCASSLPVIFTPGEIHFISNDPNKLRTILNTLWQLVT